MDTQESTVKIHDSNGKFAQGNPGGPGRPRKKPTTKALLQTLTNEAVMLLSDLLHSQDKGLAIKAASEILRFALAQEDNAGDTSGLSRSDFINYFAHAVYGSESESANDTAKEISNIKTCG